MYVDYKELGKRIAARRKELGLKQSQVNKMAGLSDKYLSNIERATSILSIDVLMKLCTVLQITPNDLLLGTTEENLGCDKAIESRLQSMTVGQKKLTLSLIDWIISQKISEAE